MGEQRWRVVLERDEDTGDWAVWCPELPGCSATGETREAALASIRDAIAVYLQPDPIELAPGAEEAEVVV